MRVIYARDKKRTRREARRALNHAALIENDPKRPATYEMVEARSSNRNRPTGRPLRSAASRQTWPHGTNRRALAVASPMVR
jgi:hypothetical protein